MRKSSEKPESVGPQELPTIDFGLDVFSLPSSTFTAEQLELLKVKTLSDIRSRQAEEKLTKSFEQEEKKDVKH